MTGGLGSALGLIGAFFPPDLSLSYLGAALVPVVQTIAMAAGGMLIACLVGVPLAMVIGARLPGSGILYGALSAVRAVPDLTLAILCVIVVGLGPAAGMSALAVFYTAMVGKVFADLFRAADWRPLEALRATGASGLSVALFGLFPLTLNDLISMGCYSFECAVRAAVIVGAVGGGGLGTELVGTLNAFDYHRATTLIIILVLIVTALDSLSWWLRRNPRVILLFVPLGAAALWTYRPEMVALRHAASAIGAMFPPALPQGAINRLPRLFIETVFIAVAGTALAAALAIPLALASARNMVPVPVASAVRALLETLRAVPEVIWGLILVTLIGVGPIAGVFALGIHSAGVLGKLYAESCENVRLAPVQAIESTGAGRLAVAFFGIVPLASGAMAVHTLFRLEWNLRAATVVGMIGAGGIGQALYNAQQLFFYDQMMAYVLITWAMVMLSDALSARTRRHFGWAHVIG
ncbi:MAG TPA: phosphonate ABC transporter, permease protein PhnE [Alphaproteobacteria bacterium]|nr:phosphonate ABC transporter, permease protein PhnE [Alphaproteobacteria bacterium]